jgi:hypothetical protein
MVEMVNEEQESRIKELKKRLRRLVFKQKKSTVDLIGMAAIRKEIEKISGESKGGGGIGIRRMK